MYESEGLTMKRVFSENQVLIMKSILKKNASELTFHYSKGNVKLPFMNFGTTSVLTCPAAFKAGCKCTEYCYSENIENNRDNVFKGNYENLVLFLKNPEKFELEFDIAVKCYELECKLKNKPAIVRFNQSGDFFNIDYAKMIIRVIRNNPGVFFYGYTKQWYDDKFDFINELPFHSIKNANIMFSAIENVDFPEKYSMYRKTYALHLKEAYSLIENNDNIIHCSGNCATCDACVYGKTNVCFVIHGPKGIDKIPDFEIYPYTKSGITRDLARYTNVKNPCFFKSTAKTFQGLRDIYCKKILGINDYETRTRALYTVYRLYCKGAIEVYKNGFLFNSFMI